MKFNIQLFGGVCTIDSIVQERDLDNNTSTFTITATLTSTGSSYNNSNADMEVQYKFTTEETWHGLGLQKFALPKTSSRTKTWTMLLSHNTDGSLGELQYRVNWYISSSTWGSTGVTTFTPQSIPRGSIFNTNIWDTAQRDLPRDMTSTLSFPAIQNVENVYHKLEARFMSSGTETTICARTDVSINNGYISFTLSSAEQQAIYNLMPNETTHYIRMYLYTYTDSSYQNQLGDVSIIWWTGLIPTSIIPTASFTSYTEGGDVPSSWGVWVKSKSKVNLELSGTGIYNSTINNYSISGDGVTYNASTILTNYLSQAGSLTFAGVVTDSRGRQGSTTLTINVEDYYNPTISTAQIQRCDIDGNIDNNGNYLYVTFGGSISSCSNKNTPNAVYKLGYRIHEVGSYNYVLLATNTNSYSASGMLYTDGIYPANRGTGTKLELSSDNTYDIQFYVSDYFAINDNNVQILDTGFDLMNWNAAGTSMAIGKVSERTANENILDIALETIIDEDATITGDLEVVGSFNINGKQLIDLIYPVGSIYMSVNNVSPQTFLGGTWVALQDRFLIGAGNNYNVNATGGSTTHTLTENEMPSHRHTIAERMIVWDTPNLTALNQASYSGPMKLRETNEGLTNYTGGGQAHSIMNPYLAVYMWKRTN